MTKYVVDKFINEFNKHQVDVDCFRIEVVNICNINFSEYDAFGITYPVHAFNTPE